MAKKASARKSPSSGGRNSNGASGGSGSFLLPAFAVAFVAIGAGAWWSLGGKKEASTREDAEAATGVGPDVMTSQAGLVNMLLGLLQEVESLSGDEQLEERKAASQRVEAEIRKIEARLDADSAQGKQAAALIKLVRSALQNDQDGTKLSDEEWSEESLLKNHGLVTYASQAYWDEAYTANKYGDSFDWYGAWAQADVQGRALADFIRPHLIEAGRILVVGCGNSNMSVYMHGEGYRDIVNVDISEPVIAQMLQRYGHLGMEWRAMDAGALEYADDSFDTVIEKGLFDALYAGTGAHVQAVLREVERVLKPGAKFITVSFSGDRLEKLFSDVEDGTQPPLKCGETGQLQYMKKSGEGTTESQVFHVFACSKPPS